MLLINDLGRHNGPLLDVLRPAMEAVLQRGYYILGPENRAFEEEFAAYLGIPAAVAVGNGTDALELSLRALDVGPGQEVITVANAGNYATTAILSVGAIPRYVDVDDDSLLVDVNQVGALVGPQTRAVVATHLYGRMVDIEALRVVCDRHGLALIEDCAQAHGARRGDVCAGAWGDLSTFSFYPTKNLGALGDGGLVGGRDKALVERVRRLRQYGWSAKYEVVDRGGRNSRLDELQAAILRVKLPLLDGWNARRRAIVMRYRAGLLPLGWRLPSAPGPDDVCHLFVVRPPRRDVIREILKAHGVASDVHYPIPDHLQTAATSTANTVRTTLPVTEKSCREILTLPCFPELQDAEVDRVIAACAAAMETSS